MATVWPGATWAPPSSQRNVLCPIRWQRSPATVSIAPETGSASEEGTLEFLGRLDSQVKIRGFRVEPGEVETVLGRHPGVRQAAVVSRRGTDGLVELVAYFSLDDGATVVEVKKFLESTLPTHLIPRFLVALPELPRTPSGKLDRKTLASQDLDPADQGHRNAEPPASNAEKVIARVWSKVLGIDEIDVNTSFFDLGGNSLSLLRVHKGLAETSAPGLGVTDLFRYPTVRSLARALTRSDAEDNALQDARDRDRKRRLQRARRRDSLSRN